MSEHCPRCGSPQPHPAVQFEGEVSPCSDDYHRQTTPPHLTGREREEAIRQSNQRAGGDYYGG